MTRPNTLLLILLIFLISCTNQQTTTSNAQKSDTTKIGAEKSKVTTQVHDTPFRLGFFKGVPDTIEGCGEYFTYDTCKVTNDRYIFLSNLTDFAIIKIRGKDVYLKTDTAESKETDENSYIAVYKGQVYKAILKVKKIKAYDEGGFYSGTLQISGDNINVIFKVHGEAGC